MMQRPQERSKRRPARRGAAIVEAALVLPIVLLFILGLFEYGRFFLMTHICNNAVSAGANYACKHTTPIILGATTFGNATSDVVNIVNANLGAQQLSGASVTVYLSDNVGNPVADSYGNNPGLFTSAAAGQYVSVRLTGTYSFGVSGLLGLPATSTQTFTAVRRSEGN